MCIFTFILLFDCLPLHLDVQEIHARKVYTASGSRFRCPIRNKTQLEHAATSRTFMFRFSPLSLCTQRKNNLEQRVCMFYNGHKKDSCTCTTRTDAYRSINISKCREPKNTKKLLTVSDVPQLYGTT